MEKLREVNSQQNNWNQQLRNNSKSGVKGVGWRESRQKWRARISVNENQICLGHFNNLLDAARAYNEAAIKYFGEYAWINDLTKLMTNDKIQTMEIK